MKKFFLRFSLVTLFITFLGCTESAEQPPLLVSNSGPLVTDIDGNVYQSVVIGSQTWSKSNLNVSKYSDGTPIPEVKEFNVWGSLTTGAWCYYLDVTENGVTYGKLYNWYAVAGIYDAASAENPALRKKLAPDGWHISTNDEWTTLTNYLGGEQEAGNKLKETGTAYWQSPNTGNNSSGFSARPGGTRFSFASNDRYYMLLGRMAWWYTATEASSRIAMIRTLNLSTIEQGISDKNQGCSVRFVRDKPENITDYDGNVYPLVTICDQTWTKNNLNVSHYTDGTPIPQVTDDETWANLTTGAWCYYNNTTENGTTYGKLYNWYAIAGIHDQSSAANPALRKKLAPVGTHIPTDAEWTTLTNCLGGENVAGGKLKSTGTEIWQSPNTEANNSSGFTGLPAGYRYNFGPFYTLGYHSTFWSKSEADTSNAWYRYLVFNLPNAYRSTRSKQYGFAVRCLTD
jgi:uncharacterized protein (TIGR02145 family)